MSEVVKHTRRRWFQFGVGNLLWLVLLVALAVYGINEHRQRTGLEAERDNVLLPEIAELRIRADARLDAEQMMEDRRKAIEARMNAVRPQYRPGPDVLPDSTGISPQEH